MEEEVEFQPSYAMLTLSLAAGEAVRVEPGAMVAQENVTMETKSSGGFFKGLKKAVLGGESFFLNTFTGGEGLVMNFSGQGTIWIQTRNLSGLASILIPFIPTHN